MTGTEAREVHWHAGTKFDMTICNPLVGMRTLFRNWNSEREAEQRWSSVTGWPRFKIAQALLTIFVASAALPACTNDSQLSAPATVLATSDGYDDTGVPAARRTTVVPILYATDRVEESSAGSLRYGLGRSASLAIGQAPVSFGRGLNWEQLTRAGSSTGMRVNIGFKARRELVRLPETPLPFRVVEGRTEALPPARAELDEAQARAVRAISAQIEQFDTDEVFIFVPGFANTFDDGLLTLANIWHSTGRVGVPILYSWPSGNGGLTGYFRDSTAGDFSVFHFKQFLGLLAQIPSLKRVHILAHSRGTDVVTTGLRELIIAERAAGRSPQTSLKIANLILAAPDLDFGVVRQRLIAERFGPAIGQITVYMNASDGALAFAQRLASGQRFGRVTRDDVSVSDRKVLERVENVAFVEIENPGGGIGHAYYRDNPSVLSDIAIATGQNLRPGEPDRPLELVGGNFWRLPDGYPFTKR